jgi:hypothetical protein
MYADTDALDQRFRGENFFISSFCGKRGPVAAALSERQHATAAPGAGSGKTVDQLF